MSGQTPAQILRDMEARNAAIRRYAQAHDHFADLEQRLAANPDIKPEDVETAHTMALVCLRAVRVELDDPTPRQW